MTSSVLALTAVVVVGFVVYTLQQPAPRELAQRGAHPLRRLARDRGARRRLPRRSAAAAPCASRSSRRVDRMDLTNIPMEIVVKGAYSKGGIPLNVQGIANVKLPGHEPRLSTRSSASSAARAQEICAVAQRDAGGQRPRRARASSRPSR